MDAYVPVYSNGQNTWHPSNDAAFELVHLVHAWEDISKLNEIRIRVREGDPIADKLLLKHILVEFFSALDHAKALQGIIRKAPKLINGRSAPHRYITKTELEAATTAFKELWRELAPVQKLIARIRNNIGAHRSAEIGGDLEELWNELDAEKFISVLNRIPTLISAVDSINIYDWSAINPENGAIRILGCQILHPWEEAFNEEDLKETSDIHAK